MMRAAISPAGVQPWVLMGGKMQDAGGHRTTRGRRMFHSETSKGATTMASKPAGPSSGTRQGPRYRSVANPRWMEEHQKIAGEVLAMCGSTQRAIAGAFRASDVPGSDAWVSRLVRGNAAVAAHMERVEALAQASWTDPGPLAAAPFGTLCRVRARSLSDEDLSRAVLHSLQVETERESAENVAQCRRMLAREKDEDEVARLEDELASAFVLSMGSEAAALGLLWERRLRRVGR